MSEQQTGIVRNTMTGSLVLAKKLGFEPKTVIDVGAALGTFNLYETFPNARHLLIEPIVENEPYLAKICRKLKNAEYIIAAAAKESGVLTLSVSPGMVHSSVSKNPVTDSSNPDLRKIPAITLDGICKERNLPGPYLIKVDVDGKELDVLAGATEILQQTEYVIVEVTLFGQMYDVMSFMKSQGFVAYDIVDLGYRPIDAALWQIDMAFVKEFGQFRRDSSYATKEQDIEALESHLKAYREGFIAHIDAYYSDPLEANPEVTQTEFTEEYVII
ncbi:FkbM family methyltransferase [Microcoleus sp. LEGE 07076]|uniref:FkbM family methyltransferase n=1 Tax=Microcoleus sp. LEGE 07076 TaxID=915322 RepID=UPI00187FA929|nr:FkbM family methyltransferase [Microcoleus sp. LEGE 07076]MBE9183663.1 FkbM family methyltransferase [Microcoleus sp. LEGE 07076]